MTELWLIHSKPFLSPETHVARILSAATQTLQNSLTSCKKITLQVWELCAVENSINDHMSDVFGESSEVSLDLLNMAVRRNITDHNLEKL